MALAEVRKLGSALSQHTGQYEWEATSHLFQPLSVLLMKGNASLFLNRITALKSNILCLSFNMHFSMF